MLGSEAVPAYGGDERFRVSVPYCSLCEYHQGIGQVKVSLKDRLIAVIGVGYLMALIPGRGHWDGEKDDELFSPPDCK
jgi:hypothetical protein